MYPQNTWEIVENPKGSAEYSVGTAELHHVVHCSRVSLGRIALLRLNYRFQNSLYLHNFLLLKLSHGK